MDKGTIETRVVELTKLRAETVARLDAARALHRDALVSGEPRPQDEVPVSLLLTELEAVDAAMAELRDRLVAANDADARKARLRQVERAVELTAERRAKAEAVDAAIVALHCAWGEYAGAVRDTVGSVAQAGGDTTPLRRVNFVGRQSDGLVKALIAASGVEMVRALGIETSNMRHHGISLTAAEDRVALSLQAELARVRATSPQRGVARDAQRELEEIEGRMADPLELED